MMSDVRVTKSGVLLGCHVCGTIRFVQVLIMTAPEQLQIEVDPRDHDIVGSFAVTHLRPYAFAIKA